MKKLKVSKTALALLVSLFILAFSFLVLNTNYFNLNYDSHNLLFNQDFFTQSISTVILPHHDLAAREREIVLSEVAARITPKTVIIVSTNHFNAGGYEIETTDRNWRLANSFFSADTEKIHQLNLPIVNAAFEREHGIFNLLAPVNNVFPDAKVIPIIIKDTTSVSSVDNLKEKLNEICSKNCLLIASVDFSHYQPASVASLHDIYSIKALSNLDEDMILKTEVDSNQTLYLAINWAKLHKTQRFQPMINTNSGILTNSPDAESTSYVLGWYEIGEAIKFNQTTFVAGNNLQADTKRLVSGVDETIDLADSHAMGMLCYQRQEFCGVNRLLWGPDFYRDILNGLVIVGEIQADSYKLVLVPTDAQTHVPLQGEAKLAVINKIRGKLNLSAVTITNGYDTIDINK